MGIEHAGGMTSARSQGMSRRRFLRRSSIGSALFYFGLHGAVGAPAIDVREIRVISQQPELYHGWPTLARRRNGQLVLAWSGGRQAHVCPFGRVEWMRSDDSGASWTWPQVLLDSPMDDRDAGILETAKGTLLVTTFTSLAYEPILEQALKIASGQAGAWPESKLRAWQAAHRRLGAEERRAELGQWMIRSCDGGRIWSTRYATMVNSPHGPIQLADGRLLYAGKELWTGQKRVGVCESADDGQSWRWLAEIPARAGDSAEHYHELHAVETLDGRIIVQIRNHNPVNNGETLQSESTNGGRSWSEPRAIGVWGLPSFLLRLRDGRLLMTYGHRRAPFGNQARLSEDQGRTWSEAMLISGDGTSGDLGYPSTVELEDGTLRTVWYELLKGAERAVLRQASWSLR